MNRQKLIKKIEEARNSRVIAYITGDRKPFSTKIGDDVVPILRRRLEESEISDKISLFLYTRGGDMVAPLRIVKLIRNYAEKFEVIIPYRAHSAGTLLALGADEILMGKLGELSPTDPSTMHPFNPSNSQDSQQQSKISVEDINSYFLLAQEKANVKDERMVEVYEQLVEKIHPLSLGNAYRAIRMARQIARKLLKIHMKDDEKVKKIVEAITSDICIHGYPIARDEARNLGLKVKSPDEKLEEIIWKLYKEYAKELKLDVSFQPGEFLDDEEQESKFEHVSAYIEGNDFSEQFVYEGKVRKIVQDDKPRIDMNIASGKWRNS